MSQQEASPITSTISTISDNTNRNENCKKRLVRMLQQMEELKTSVDTRETMDLFQNMFYSVTLYDKLSNILTNLCDEEQKRFVELLTYLLPSFNRRLLLIMIWAADFHVIEMKMLRSAIEFLKDFEGDKTLRNNLKKVFSVEAEGLHDLNIFLDTNQQYPGYESIILPNLAQLENFEAEPHCHYWWTAQEREDSRNYDEQQEQENEETAIAREQQETNFDDESTERREFAWSVADDIDFSEDSGYSTDTSSTADTSESTEALLQSLTINEPIIGENQEPIQIMKAEIDNVLGKIAEIQRIADELRKSIEDISNKKPDDLMETISSVEQKLISKISELDTTDKLQLLSRLLACRRNLELSLKKENAPGTLDYVVLLRNISEAVPLLVASKLALPIKIRTPMEDREFEKVFYVYISKRDIPYKNQLTPFYIISLAREIIQSQRSALDMSMLVGCYAYLIEYARRSVLEYLSKPKELIFWNSTVKGIHDMEPDSQQDWEHCIYRIYASSEEKRQLLSRIQDGVKEAALYDHGMRSSLTAFIHFVKHGEEVNRIVTGFSPRRSAMYNYLVTMKELLFSTEPISQRADRSFFICDLSKASETIRLRGNPSLRHYFGVKRGECITTHYLVSENHLWQLQKTKDMGVPLEPGQYY